LTKILESLAVALAGLAVGVNATAQISGPRPAAVVLRWNAPSECPTGDQVLHDARTLAAGRGATASRHPVTVDAVVARLAADRWSVTLAIGAAQRRIEASSCAQLARAAALFVALLMEPSTGAPDETAPDLGLSPQSPPSPTPRPAAPTPVAGRDAPAPPRRAREVSLLAAVGLIIDSAVMPRAELLGAVEVGIRYRRLEAELQAIAGPAQEKMIDGAAGARLRPVSAALRPCYAPLITPRFRLGLCAEGEVGWIHAEGVGLGRVRATDAAWVSLGGELAASWAVGANFEARLGAGALVPVLRPNFELTGLGSVFEQGVALRAETAAVIRF
jgi:hypothetical protein